MKYKYMAILFYGISLYTGKEIAIEDENFKQLLLGFIMNYYLSNRELMNEIFDIKYQEGKGFTYRIDYKEVEKYGCLLYDEPRKFCQLYDEVGDEKVKEITDLACLFCQYVEIIDDMNNNVRIRH